MVSGHVPQKKHLLHEKKEAQLVIALTDYAFCASQQPWDHDWSMIQRNMNISIINKLKKATPVHTCDITYHCFVLYISGTICILESIYSLFSISVSRADASYSANITEVNINFWSKYCCLNQSLEEGQKRLTHQSSLFCCFLQENPDK